MSTSKPKTVAFLGPAASYSHQATKSAFPEPQWELKATTTIRDVFDVVQAGDATYGVVPFENSTHGTVIFTLDCLADRSDTYTDIAVCSEIYLDVHHFLLGKIDPQASSSSEPHATSEIQEHPSKPLTSLAHIQRIYSHPQAFGQSGLFLQKYLKGVELIDVSSTSKAAALAAVDDTGTSAAIAGEIAASIVDGLDILARNVEDRDDNTTRFFVIYKKGEEQQLPPLTTTRSGEEEGKYKSLVSFTVAHRTPGALADVLDCFKKLGLNLTSINSLPSLIEPFQYLFFVEFEVGGIPGADVDTDERLRKLEEMVKGVPAERWRFLGSWRDMRSKSPRR
ncbi:P-protein [Rhypophila sp. PSN 637]